MLYYNISHSWEVNGGYSYIVWSSYNIVNFLQYPLAHPPGSAMWWDVFFFNLIIYLYFTLVTVCCM